MAKANTNHLDVANVQTVDGSQLATLLDMSMSAGDSLLITGKPGIGKTSQIKQCAERLGYDLIISHPAIEDPTKPQGLPWMIEGDEEARFYPFGELAKAKRATKPTIWFLDDLGQATPAVQASYMPLLDHNEIPDCVTFVAATNRRQDKAGVSGLLEPVKSRFRGIVELELSLNSWINDYALPQGIEPDLIAFLRLRTELFHDWKPTPEIVNQPMPRTWEFFDKKLKTCAAKGIVGETRRLALASAVGVGPTAEYAAFEDIKKHMISIDAILLNPTTAPMPDASKPAAVYALASGLAHRANDKNFGHICQYSMRLYNEANMGEFAALIIRDSLRKNAALANTSAFISIGSSDFGKFLLG